MDNLGLMIVLKDAYSQNVTSKNSKVITISGEGMNDEVKMRLILKQG